jgi:hypothetical protein
LDAHVPRDPDLGHGHSCGEKALQQLTGLGKGLKHLELGKKSLIQLSAMELFE